MRVCLFSRRLFAYFSIGFLHETVDDGMAHFLKSQNRVNCPPLTTTPPAPMGCSATYIRVVVRDARTVLERHDVGRCGGLSGKAGLLEGLSGR